MTTFHRLTTPTYFMSGGWPPSGYDYINNTPGGSQAPADGAKVGGNYPGTYFIDFGEDATSTHGNRAHKALAQNCDQLDDWLNSSVAVPAEVDAATSGTPFTYYQLSGEVFVGKSGTPNNQDERNNLILVLNPTTGEVLQDAFGQPIRCSLLHDGGASPSGSNVIGTQASGFYTAPTVTFSTSIPTSTSFRIVYGKRSSLSQVATSDIDAFMRNLLRGAEMVQFTGGDPWYDGDTNAPNTVDGQLQYMISALVEDTAEDQCGLDRLGCGAMAGAHIPLSAGSGKDVVKQLSNAACGLNVNNTITKKNIFLPSTPYDYNVVFDRCNLQFLNGPNLIMMSSSSSLTFEDHLNTPLFRINDDGNVDFLSEDVRIGNGIAFVWSSTLSSQSADPHFYQEQQSGTGVGGGASFMWTAQQGRAQTGVAANNNGGGFIFNYGLPGTGGSGAAGEFGQRLEKMHGVARDIDRWTFARDQIDLSIGEGSEIYRYTLPTYSVLLVKIDVFQLRQDGSINVATTYYYFKRYAAAAAQVGSGDGIAGETEGPAFYILATASGNDAVFSVAGGTESENTSVGVVFEFTLYNPGAVTPY